MLSILALNTPVFLSYVKSTFLFSSTLKFVTVILFENCFVNTTLFNFSLDVFFILNMQSFSLPIHFSSFTPVSVIAMLVFSTGTASDSKLCSAMLLALTFPLIVNSVKPSSILKVLYPIVIFSSEFACKLSFLITNPVSCFSTVKSLSCFMYEAVSPFTFGIVIIRFLASTSLVFFIVISYSASEISFIFSPFNFIPISMLAFLSVSYPILFGDEFSSTLVSASL